MSPKSTRELHSLLIGGKHYHMSWWKSLLYGLTTQLYALEFPGDVVAGGAG